MSQLSFFQRCLDMLCGRRNKTVESPAPPDDSKWQSRIAALELELKERDARIATMQQEYSTLSVDKARLSISAGEEQLAKVFKQLAGSLSNLAALDALAAAGKSVEVTDVLALASGVEKGLARFGLERIGTVGESVLFDTSIHQRMSGGDVREGTPIVVRIPGYRLGQTMLLKAMVSTREAQSE